MNHLCDADASGAERAMVAVYTPSGPIELCNHHWRKHCVEFAELGYYTSVMLEPPIDGGVNASLRFTNTRRHQSGRPVSDQSPPAKGGMVGLPAGADPYVTIRHRDASIRVCAAVSVHDRRVT